jgi:hypothetical protein
VLYVEVLQGEYLLTSLIQWAPGSDHGLEAGKSFFLSVLHNVANRKWHEGKQRKDSSSKRFLTFFLQLD